MHSRLLQLFWLFWLAIYALLQCATVLTHARGVQNPSSALQVHLSSWSCLPRHLQWENS